MPSPIPPWRPSLIADDPRPVAAVFRSPVFNASETFVAAQAAELVRYQPLVIGLVAKGHVPPALDGRILLATARQQAALKLLGGSASLAAHLVTLRPKLIHAHFGPDATLALPLAERLGVPLVTSLRGYDVSRSPSRLLMSGRLSWMRYAVRRRALMARGTLFLAVSEALREQAVAAGHPADRTLTHYNGVDLARFRPGGAPGEAVILHVGRLVEKKGTAVLLRAFAQLRRQHPRASLTIIGDGPLRDPLELLAGELGLGESVQFVGFQPPEAVSDWMKRAAVVAVPSLRARDGDSEGLPNVAVESAASGRPVVATDHGGIGEAVMHGRTGFLVPEGAVEPLAQRLGELLASADLRRRFGAAARELAEQKFDRRRQMGRLECIYDAVVAGDCTSTSAIATR
jgi:colanic acid/amylovoran biosynthesis glycosyltransferase